MSCDLFQEDLSALADGELGAAEASTLEAHVAGCPSCQLERAALERLRERVQALPRAQAPRSLLAAVEARVGGGARGSTLAPPEPASTGASGADPAACDGPEGWRLSAFLDHELGAAEQAETEQHLGQCPACRERLVELDDLIGRVRALPRVAAPMNLHAIVSARLEAEPTRLARPTETLGAATASPRRAPTAAGRTPSARLERPRGAGGEWTRLARPEPSRLARPDSAPLARPEPTRLARPDPARFARPAELLARAQRFLVAASLVGLALGSLAVATPNGDPRPHRIHSAQPASFGSSGRSRRAPGGPVASVPPPGASASPAVPARRRDPERSLTLLCDDLDTGDRLVVGGGLRASSGPLAVAPTAEAHAYCARGTAADVREALSAPPAPLALEEPARLDALVPPPLDRVLGRSGEVYVGKVEREDSSGIALRAGPLLLELSPRNVVRVERASTDPVEVGLVLRARARTPQDE